MPNNRKCEVNLTLKEDTANDRSWPISTYSVRAMHDRSSQKPAAGPLGCCMPLGVGSTNTSDKKSDEKTAVQSVLD